MRLFKPIPFGILALVGVMFLASAVPAFALNCVQYVHKTTGLDISGDGWQWWSNANGRYERGHKPKENAILVFDRTGAMERGHVAIVSKILNDHLITINHANWTRIHGRGLISTGIMVEDVSEKNDWSRVRVWDENTRAYGRENPILGFVYGGKPQMDIAANDLEDNNPASEAEAALNEAD